MKIPADSGKIITLTGVRRSGKTYHLLNLINQLKTSGIAPERILYINFEDERLQASSSDLDLFLQAYQELYPHLELSECYFFFDEIQEAEGWEKFIARLCSTISQRIFITGSNARLLFQEIATALRGRTITFEVYPLSFFEYAQVLSPELNPYSSADKARLANLFERVLFGGGFPELVEQKLARQNKDLTPLGNLRSISWQDGGPTPSKEDFHILLDKQNSIADNYHISIIIHHENLPPHPLRIHSLFHHRRLPSGCRDG